MLFDLYESHRTSYKRTDTLAIFIDANGKPMTSKTYARKFQKVKKEFIKRLSESEDISTQSYAIYLSTYKWSTHICRGVFSNLIADNSNNVSEIAAWRGDKSLVSSLTYLNDNKVLFAFNEEKPFILSSKNLFIYLFLIFLVPKKKLNSFFLAHCSQIISAIAVGIFKETGILKCSLLSVF